MHEINVSVLNFVYTVVSGIIGGAFSIGFAYAIIRKDITHLFECFARHEKTNGENHERIEREVAAAHKRIDEILQDGGITPRRRRDDG